ncbi:MAG: hypothetical protein EXQ79_08575 [Acidimicrobiia bacterium]|nr:hypothetical protein [Acidimicrobiia bacterium]
MLTRTMRRALVAGVVTMAVSAGTAGAAMTAKAVPVKAWTAAVCKDFTQWERRLSELGSRDALADPAAGKTAITKFLTRGIKVTTRLIKDLKSEGFPSGEHGTEIAAVFITSAKSVRVTYATAKTDAAALPTDDPTAFATAAQALVTQLRSGGASLDTTLATAATRYPASALNEAFLSTEACTATP